MTDPRAFGPGVWAFPLLSVDLKKDAYGQQHAGGVVERIADEHVPARGAHVAPVGEEDVGYIEEDGGARDK